MHGPANLATYIALGLILAGFAVIFAAWDGAADLDRIAGQFPYLLSGGLAGLGFIVAGGGVLVVQTARELGAERTRQTAELQQHMDAVVQLVASGSVNGSSARTAVVERDDALVVAGRSSYHAQSCRLVAHRDGLERLSRDAAERAGLSPCRICKP